MHRLIELQPGEKIEFIVRRHWLIFALNLAIPLVMVGAFGLVSQLAKAIIPELGQAPYYNIFLLVISAVLLFSWLLMLIIWIDYYFDIWVVTNQRLIDVDQIGLFNRKTAELNLRHVQDVSVYQQGFLQTTFGFGSINIQSAGTVVKFNFDKAPDPHGIESRILELYNAAIKNDPTEGDVAENTQAPRPAQPA